MQSASAPTPGSSPSTTTCNKMCQAPLLRTEEARGDLVDRVLGSRRRRSDQLLDCIQVDLAVDPDTLLSKLEAFGGRPISQGLSRGERDARIRELADVFLRDTMIVFYGERVSSRFAYLPASAFTASWSSWRYLSPVSSPEVSTDSSAGEYADPKIAVHGTDGQVHISRITDQGLSEWIPARPIEGGLAPNTSPSITDELTSLGLFVQDEHGQLEAAGVDTCGLFPPVELPLVCPA